MNNPLQSGKVDEEMDGWQRKKTKGRGNRCDKKRIC
jgi:hypothetical protein